jgi:RimJ/RimL family protein N-acetyltransferase
MLHSLFSTDQNIVLENDCVLLRPLAMSDANYLQVFSENEPDLWQYSLQTAAGFDNLTQYLASAVQGRESGQAYPFIIYDKQRNAYAGTTRFYEIDLPNQSLLLGYTWLGRDFQRTGINRHCKYLLLQFAFEQAGFHRVAFRADINNEKSIRAMESIGCKHEGVLREHMLLANGLRRTSVLLSILANEWQDSVKNQLITQLNSK